MNESEKRLLWRCRQCGGPWLADGLIRKSRFCSPECKRNWNLARQKLPNETRICVVCQKPFTPNRGVQQTCGAPICIRRNHLVGIREAHNRKRRKANELKQSAFRCPVCGGAWPNQKQFRSNSLYCSKACKGRGTHVNSNRRFKSDPAYAEKVRARNREWDRRTRKQRTAEKKRYRHSNVHARIARRLRNRLREVLIANNCKRQSALKLLGCDVPFFRKHIESQFKPWMTWANWGTDWHLDHIHPCASFNLFDPKQVALCFHWTNFQPLATAANQIKAARVTVPQLPLLLPA